MKLIFKILTAPAWQLLWNAYRDMIQKRGQTF